jgi:hypothetical protein
MEKVKELVWVCLETASVILLDTVNWDKDSRLLILDDFKGYDMTTEPHFNI